ncbi:hypothetical protein K432DRAFT_53063 [Lepidopterella palustris CBS 459.81]|uniref:Uncharacterized protein n=1 Tax=Lepidopterella palustris CBS 459.81 TaxID=1314670 RepID=A0A8E2EA95_9PEZI|nr:hypothetical protein K432DRAFT_53063 [Lepidopterella palustris CBS 459.81]
MRASEYFCLASCILCDESWATVCSMKVEFVCFPSYGCRPHGGGMPREAEPNLLGLNAILYAAKMRGSGRTKFKWLLLDALGWEYPGSPPTDRVFPQRKLSPHLSRGASADERWNLYNSNRRVTEGSQDGAVLPRAIKSQVCHPVILLQRSVFSPRNI